MAEGKNALSGIPFFVQVLILFVLGGVIAGLADYVLCADLRADTEKKKQDLEKLREDNRKGAIVRDNLKAYQKRYEQAQGELRDLRELLPEEAEISKVLQNIREQAQEQRLTVKNFDPRIEVKKDFYREKPISVQVIGLYNNLGRFFQQLATYRRILSISEVEIKKLQEQTENRNIEATFVMTAFLASEQDIINVGDTAPTKPAPPAAAGTAGK